MKMSGQGEPNTTERAGWFDRLRHQGAIHQIVRYVVSIILLLACWEIASLIITAVKGRALLPDPYHAMSEVVRLAPILFRHFWVSAWRLVLAMLLAFSTGYPLGLLIGHERKLDEIISPIIYIVYPIPQVAFILLLFLVFGIGNPVKVAIVAVALFFQILVSARGAAKLIDQEHLTSVLSVGASRWQVYRHVVLPATLPSILTSLRVSVGLGMAFLYIAETTATMAPGLGSFVKSSQFNQAQAFAGILMMAFLGLILYIMIDVLERVLCRWKYVRGRGS